MKQQYSEELVKIVVEGLLPSWRNLELQELYGSEVMSNLFKIEMQSCYVWGLGILEIIQPRELWK